MLADRSIVTYRPPASCGTAAVANVTAPAGMLTRATSLPFRYTTAPSSAMSRRYSARTSPTLHARNARRKYAVGGLAPPPSTRVSR